MNINILDFEKAGYDVRESYVEFSENAKSDYLNHHGRKIYTELFESPDYVERLKSEYGSKTGIFRRCSGFDFEGHHLGTTGKRGKSSGRKNTEVRKRDRLSDGASFSLSRIQRLLMRMEIRNDHRRDAMDTIHKRIFAALLNAIPKMEGRPCCLETGVYYE